jgi:hypothetical protein
LAEYTSALISLETIASVRVSESTPYLNPKLLSAKLPTSMSRATTAERKVALLLIARQQRRKEQFFYHNKTLPSLPRTKQTKRGLRQMGRGLFARNSLKRPQTLLGVKNLLLPPVTSLEQITMDHTPGFVPSTQDFAQKKVKPAHPQI